MADTPENKANCLADCDCAGYLFNKGSRSSIGKGECQKTSEKRGVSRRGGHVVDTAGPRRGVNCHQPAKIDSELATLIAAWTKLPEPIRGGIIAMVQAVTKR